MFLFVLLLLVYAIPSNGFQPLPISTSGSSSSATHDSITRCAFAIVTNEYIRTRFAIKITPPKITKGICPSSFFTKLKSVFPNITSRGGKTYSDWRNTLIYIVGRNTQVDVTEQTDAESHFDSESFIAGSALILERYQSAVQALKEYDYEDANEYFGKMTHTLQDFYSHSNWIEMNQTQPQPDLGIKVMTASQFAGPKVRTCKNCASGSVAVCQSNNDITKGLTSGYFSLVLNIFNKKPVGKCSHGGSFDATRNSDAIGGINKDTLTSIHGYLHQSAAQTAYLATLKILRQFRTKVTDVPFGRFLNILPRVVPSTRSKLLLSTSFVYTTILNNLRKADSFTRIQQVVSSLAQDSYYKAHILSIAAGKRVAIDIIRQKNVVFSQDLSKSTGGLYILYDPQSQVNIDRNRQTELIELFYSKSISDNISITIDRTCSSLFLELITNDPISSLNIQLKNKKQTISPSSIVTNTGYYKAYSFDNITPETWTLVFSSLIKFKLDLRVSCSSEFRCSSRFYVNNDNPIHPGVVEWQGNLIQGKNVFLITECDDHTAPMKNMLVKLIDDTYGNPLGNSVQSTYDADNDRWITNITSIPSKSFRLKYLINDQSIQRLSHGSYQTSLIDVEIVRIDTSVSDKIRVYYRLFNYHQKSIRVKLIAKNIGTYLERKRYLLKAGEIRDDQIEFDSQTKASDMTGNMLALTVSYSQNDWNYDVISF